MGSPVLISFRDGTARCVDCKGFGLVRGLGHRAGQHYRTFKGACEAEDAGRAKPCPVCKGSGLIGERRTRDVLLSYGVDRAADLSVRAELGVRAAVFSDPGFDGSYVKREHVPGVVDVHTPAPF